MGYQLFTKTSYEKENEKKKIFSDNFVILRMENDALYNEVRKLRKVNSDLQDQITELQDKITDYESKTKMMSSIFNSLKN